MKAYKGFRHNMTCRGFKFKEGESYEEPEARLCRSGFHACMNPLDTFEYYTPATSVFHEVELDDVSDERGADDTKVCARKIKIGSKLDVLGICEAHFEFTKSKATNEQTGEEYRSSVSARDGSFVSAGDGSLVSAGDESCVSAGYGSCVSVNYESAVLAGDDASVSAGDVSSVSVGNTSAVSTGWDSVVSAGHGSTISVGRRSAVSAGHESSVSAGTASSVSVGDTSFVSCRGEASSGRNSLIAVRGDDCRAKGGIGTVIVIVNEHDDNHDIAEWKAGVIDGKILKPDTWYKLENGEFVECER